MKKLLAVATIGVVGYLVVKKIKERKNNDVVEVNEEMENEEVVENVEEEIVMDNDEDVIKVENIEVVENIEDAKENNGKIKATIVNLKDKVMVITVTAGLIVFANVRYLLKYIKEERLRKQEIKKFVDKIKADYDNYVINNR